LKVVRVHIKGWTASYRFPPFVMAQPTLPVPPLSTCYGIISAAAGRIIHPEESRIGLIAPFKAKALDLEKIYQVNTDGKIEQKNIVDREFLYDTDLYLYLSNVDLKRYFLKPRYPILLGRSYDLAYIKKTELIDLEEREDAQFQYTLLPFPLEGVAAPISALPICFTDTVPRRPLGVRGFYVVGEESVTVKGEVSYVDPDTGWGVYMHEGLR
jgi:CRISPR-associated protein Cas5t